jgi:hypothetical protein
MPLVPHPDAHASQPAFQASVATPRAGTPPTLAILETALTELEARRAKLAPLLAEADQLDTAIEEQRRAVARVRGEGKFAPRPTAWLPGADSDAGRALAALRSHPRGLALPVLARVSEVPAASLSGILPRLVQAGLAIRPAKDFYRATGVDVAQSSPALDQLSARRAARA